MNNLINTLKHAFSQNSEKKSSAQVAGLFVVGFLIRLVWVAHADYTAEDAYITFQFARRLADGHGFVYNIGEPIYGTTTPLFTLLMAGWLFLTKLTDVAFAAHLADMIASLGSLLLLALTLKRLNVSHSAQLVALGILVFSSKIYLLEMQGMETPILALLMMASWYALVCNRPGWAGFFAGCLLWTRIDLLLWPVVLILVAITLRFKNAVQLGAATALTYLPWVVFAWFYFGSLIPYTVTAKWVVYSVGGPPLEAHLAAVIKGLTPFAFSRAQSSEQMLVIIGCIVAGVALWQGWRSGRENRLLFVLPVFALFETARLVLTGATFFSRYLFPLLWVILILFAMGLVSLWQILSRRWSLSIWVARGGLVLGLALIATQAIYRLGMSRFEQTHLNNGSLRMLGTWLNTHAAADATIYLEPLGYVGYYANRKMIDEIGLVTPAVIDLRVKGIEPSEHFRIFWPDYLIMHCDDGLRRKDEQADFADHYQIVVGFNPLGFDPALPMDWFDDVASIRRNACYDIWQRVEP